ncbi:MAG: FGGY family carbohydrate kinase, partial [Actinomycetia bacterium]|nr:FGGY family carbohydrate kinase [Actinomycetes bacterium]
MDVVVGLDFGTTSAKALIRPRGDSQEAPILVTAGTTWASAANGGAELDPSVAARTAIELLGRAVRAAERAWGGVTVAAMSVTGLGESGVLLDRAGRPVRAAVAWYDPRGEAELAELAETRPEVAAAFPGVTGLPWSAQASFAKLLWSREREPAPAGSCWLSVPEWIVHSLGGERVREPSLASRTGLIAQRTGQPDPELLDLVRAPADLLPPPAPAGAPVGRITHPDAPSAALGAVLSVAGHDHPV